MVSKKKFINNFSIANNISLLGGIEPDTRALVVDREIDGLSEIQVKDFYHVVVVESEAALVSVPTPDIFIYSGVSPYQEHILKYDSYVFPKTLVASNYAAVNEFKKVKPLIGFYNVNYLPGAGDNLSQPLTVRKLLAGLNQDSPGVHLATILGCTAVYYTGEAQGATTVAYQDILSFTTQATRLSLANLIRPNRKTLLEEVL